MDYSQLTLRVHAVYRADLQPVSGLHLGTRTTAQCSIQRLDYQASSLEQIAEEDANP